MLHSALYDGYVVHHRYRPKRHKLRYRVFSALMDLDELPGLNTGPRVFSYNRPGMIAFYDRDHGPRNGTALRPWAEAQMRGVGVVPDGGRIELLCYLRLLGYVFNPISVYFCRRKDETLAAILYEVHNTHGEQHTYAIPVNGDQQPIRQNADKAFYVSPFIGPVATYDFVVVPPADEVGVTIKQTTDDNLVMVASFHGKRAPFTRANLVRHLCLFPLMTFKVILAIHWEALKLWTKGFKVFPHTAQASPESKT